MNPAVILADLEELDRFLVAAQHRQRWGDHICLAEQPETVNGSPEVLVEEGVEAGARITGGWADQVVAGLEGKGSEFEVRSAIARAGEGFDLQPFAQLAEEQILRGLMLGALDAQLEHQVELEPVTFKSKDPDETYMPFGRAIELFERRQVLPPAAFARLKEGARRKAFTVARLAKEELLAATHAELLKRLREGRADAGGPNLRDFQRFAKERLESAGWTPANRSHVETIYRTNIIGAYAGGRAVEMSQPSVLAALPNWQIRGVTDARQRKTHEKAHGIVLPANHPFWRFAYPPFGFNCRCRVVARSAAYLKANGLSIGPVPQGLPDPGFESGTRALIQVPAELLKKPPVNAPVVQPPRQPFPLPSPSLAPPAPSFPAPPLPPPVPPLPQPKQAAFEALGIKTGTPEEFAEAQAAAVSLFGKPLEAQATENMLGTRHVPGKARLVMRGSGANIALDGMYRTLSGEETIIMRRFKRRPDGELEVYHALMEVDKRLRGRGIGTAVLRDQIREYQRLGVKRITLTAAWTGRYTWARMGFEYTDTREAFMAARRAFQRYAAERMGAKAAAAVVKNIRSFRDLAVSRVGHKVSGQEFFADHYKDAMFSMKLELDPADPHFQRVAQYLGL